MSHDSNIDYVGAANMNEFDHDADPTDQNLMTMDNEPMLVVGYQRYKYRTQRLVIDAG